MSSLLASRWADSPTKDDDSKPIDVPNQSHPSKAAHVENAGLNGSRWADSPSPTPIDDAAMNDVPDLTASRWATGQVHKVVDPIDQAGPGASQMGEESVDNIEPERNHQRAGSVDNGDDGYPPVAENGSIEGEVVPKSLPTIDVNGKANFAAVSKHVGDAERHVNGAPNPAPALSIPTPTKHSNRVNAENTVQNEARELPSPLKMPILPSASKMRLEAPRLRKKLSWRGKTCVISLPNLDYEAFGFIKPMSLEEVHARIKQFEDEGYDTRGFDQPTEVEGTDGAVHAKPIYPSEVSTSTMLTTEQPSVRLPDLQRWASYMDWLTEQKLAALGVSSGQDESSMEQSQNMSRQSSGQYPPLPFSPPIPTASGGSIGRPGLTRGHSATMSVASPISPMMNPYGHMHRHSTMTGSPLTFAHAHQQSQSPASFGLRGFSPSGQHPLHQQSPIPGMQSFSPVLSNQSPLVGLDRTISPSLAAFRNTYGALRSPGSPLSQQILAADSEKGFSSDGSQGQKTYNSLPNLSTSQQSSIHPTPMLPQLPEEEEEDEVETKLESETAAHSEQPAYVPPHKRSLINANISAPTPRGHRHNISEGLERDVLATEEQESSKEDEVLPPTEGIADLDMAAKVAEDKQASPEKDPLGQDIDVKETTHGRKKSSARFNVAATPFAFNPAASFQPGSTAVSFAPPTMKSSTVTMPAFGFAHNRQKSSGTFNAAAPVFQPTGSYNPAGPPYESAQPGEFSITAQPTILPTLPTSDFNFAEPAPVKQPLSSDEQAVPESTSIFGKFELPDIVKPARRSKAIAIVEPKNAPKPVIDSGTYFEDAEGRITQSEDRIKRQRQRGDDGDEVPRFAEPTPLPAPSAVLGSNATPEQSAIKLSFAEEVDDQSLHDLDTVAGIDAETDKHKHATSQVDPSVPKSVAKHGHKTSSSLSALAKPFTMPDSPAAQPKLAIQVSESADDKDDLGSNGELEEGEVRDAGQGDDLEPPEVWNGGLTPTPPVIPEFPFQTTPSPRMSAFVNDDPSFDEIDAVMRQLNEAEEQAELAVEAASNAFETPAAVLKIPTPEDFNIQNLEEDVGPLPMPNPEDFTQQGHGTPVDVQTMPSPSDFIEQRSEWPIGEAMPQENETGNPTEAETGVSSQALDTMAAHLQMPSPRSFNKPTPEWPRSGAPSPSVWRNDQIYEDPASSPFATQGRAPSVGDDANTWAPINRLNKPNGAPPSDWSDVLSSPEEAKFQQRTAFFDSHVEDIIGRAIEKRLLPLEAALRGIQTSVVSASNSKDSRANKYNPSNVHSDADDEDDLSEQLRQRPMSRGKDKRFEQIKAVVLEALREERPTASSTESDIQALHSALADVKKSLDQNHSQASATRDFGEVLGALAELKSSLAQAHSSESLTSGFGEVHAALTELKSSLAHSHSQESTARGFEDVHIALAELKSSLAQSQHSTLVADSIKELHTRLADMKISLASGVAASLNIDDFRAVLDEVLGKHARLAMSREIENVGSEKETALQSDLSELKRQYDAMTANAINAIELRQQAEEREVDATNRLRLAEEELQILRVNARDNELRIEAGKKDRHELLVHLEEAEASRIEKEQELRDIREDLHIHEAALTAGRQHQEQLMQEFADREKDLKATQSEQEQEIIALRDEFRLRGKEHADMLREKDQQIQDLQDERAAANATLEEYRASSKKWRQTLEESSQERENLENVISGLERQLHESQEAHGSMRRRLEKLHVDMAQAAGQLMSEKAAWREKEDEYRSRCDLLETQKVAYVKEQEQLHEELRILRASASEANDAHMLLENVKSSNASLSDMIRKLQADLAERQAMAASLERDFHDARDAGRIEVQRTRMAMQTDIDAANYQVNIVRAELESELSRVRCELDNVKMGAEMSKARYERLLEEEETARRETLRKVNHANSVALEDARQKHDESLKETRASHARMLQHAREDKERSEYILNERLSLADAKLQHYQDRILHLEERMEITKSAAQAAAMSARSRAVPSALGDVSRGPEKISPQALRESILVLQEQLQEREARIEKLQEKVDKEAPAKLKAREDEVAWLRELLTLRGDELAGLVNTLSQPTFDRDAVRDSAIRIRANLQMEQQEKERLGNSSQSVPGQAIASLSNFASPRAASLSSAFNKWRANMESSALKNAPKSTGRQASLTQSRTPSRPPTQPAAVPLGYISGMMTPPASELRSTPVPDVSTSSLPAPHLQSRPQPRASISASHSRKRSGGPTTPLFRPQSYDRDAEDSSKLDLSQLDNIDDGDEDLDTVVDSRPPAFRSLEDELGEGFVEGEDST